jgi:hypothetical protein
MSSSNIGLLPESTQRGADRFGLASDATLHVPPFFASIRVHSRFLLLLLIFAQVVEPIVG